VQQQNNADPTTIKNKLVQVRATLWYGKLYEAIVQIRYLLPMIASELSLAILTCGLIASLFIAFNIIPGAVWIFEVVSIISAIIGTSIWIIEIATGDTLALWVGTILTISLWGTIIFGLIDHYLV
jgi:hypothetical protein